MSANNIKHYRLKLVLYKIRHGLITMVGIAIVMVFVILALFGEYIAPALKTHIPYILSGSLYRHRQNILSEQMLLEETF